MLLASSGARSFHATRQLLDHYRTLGLQYNAGPKEIKDAFIKLAKQHHPDTNPNDGAAPAPPTGKGAPAAGAGAGPTPFDQPGGGGGGGGIDEHLRQEAPGRPLSCGRQRSRQLCRRERRGNRHIRRKQRSRAP